VTKIAPQEVLYLEIVQRESCCVTQDCNKEANRERQALKKVMKKKEEEDTKWQKLSTFQGRLQKEAYTHTLKALRVRRLDKCEDRKCKTKCELETNTCHKASQYRQRDTERGKRQEWLWYSKAQHRLKEGGWATGNKPKKTASK
jgi:hypothetical protein